MTRKTNWKAGGRQSCGHSKEIILYQLLNETDQILAAPDLFKTKEQAEACAEKLRQRFVTQGFYLTAEGKRIPPDNVKLIVISVAAKPH